MDFKVQGTLALIYSTKAVKVGTDALAIQLYDITGTYDASTNTGGWGTPNSERDTTDVTTSTLEVYEPGSTTANRTIDLYNSPYTFPVTEQSVTIESKTLLGVDTNTKLTDGVWQLRSKVTVEGTVKTSINYLMILNEIESCISQQGLKITNCACKDKAVKKYQEMRRYYDAALWAYDDEDYEKAQEFAEKLTALCNDDCGCGC